MRNLWVVLVLSTACGVPDPLEFTKSTEHCLGPYNVKDGWGHLNQNKILENEFLLKRLFTNSWQYTVEGQVDINIGKPTVFTHPALLGSDRDFCDSFGGITITYEWTNLVSCHSDKSGDKCLGMDDFANGIKLEHKGVALLHELIHVYEMQHFVFNTSQHPNWDFKGYNYLNDVLWIVQEHKDAMTSPSGTDEGPDGPYGFDPSIPDP